LIIATLPPRMVIWMRELPFAMRVTPITEG
jgi:hypothetical protein